MSTGKNFFAKFTQLDFSVIHAYTTLFTFVTNYSKKCVHLLNNMHNSRSASMISTFHLFSFAGYTTMTMHKGQYTKVAQNFYFSMYNSTALMKCHV